MMEDGEWRLRLYNQCSAPGGGKMIAMMMGSTGGSVPRALIPVDGTDHPSAREAAAQLA